MLPIILKKKTLFSIISSVPLNFKENKMYSHLYAPIPDIDAYLKRIGMTRPKALTKEYLDELVYQHQLHVPFDTLDVGLLGKDISLGIEDIYNKVVVNNRGGYCFELNGLLIKLVKELGYDAYSVPCRVMQSADTVTPVLHRGNCVKIDDKKYFFDVGFSGPMPPGLVEYKEDEWQIVRGEKFRLERVGEYWFNLYRLSEKSEINNQPSIVLQVGIGEYKPVDYIGPNMICGVGPDARFRGRKTVSMRTKTGSITLSDRELSVVDNHKKTTVTIESDDEYYDTLKKIFGVDIKDQVR